MSALRNFLIYLLAVLVLATGAVAIYRPVAVSDGSAQGTVLAPLPPPFAGVERLRILLIGADDREERGRSDTLIVLDLNPATRRAVMLSIPRDMYARIPEVPSAERWRNDHGEYDKINHAYHYGGVKLARATVDELLGISLDATVKVNIDGFVKAMDTLGGVDLDVEDVEGEGRGMNYDCPQDGLVIHLKPGYQHLTGYKAMGYVRYRKSNIPGKGGTDLDRAKRQQKLIKAVIAQKLRVTKVPALYQAGREMMGCVRTTMSWRELFDLARFLRELPAGALKSATLPGDDQRIKGTYYCVLLEDEYRQVVAEHEAFLLGSGTGDAEPCRVEVLNGSGVSGAAAKAADRLSKQGFVVLTVGNAPSTSHAETVILYRGDVRAEAERAAAALGGGAVREDTGAGEAPPGTAQVQVTLGKDLAGS